MLFWANRDYIIDRPGQSLLYSGYVNFFRSLLKEGVFKHFPQEGLEGFSLTSTHSTPNWTLLGVNDQTTSSLFYVFLIHNPAMDPTGFSNWLDTQELPQGYLVMLSEHLDSKISCVISKSTQELLPQVSGCVYSPKAALDSTCSLKLLRKMGSETFWASDPRLLTLSFS